MGKNAQKNVNEQEEKVLGYGDEPELELTTDVGVCPSCGANLTFSPEDQSLRCDHCGTKIDFDKKSTSEQDFEMLYASGRAWTDDTVVFVCNNCGAKEVISRGAISAGCPYCGTTNVVETDELSGLKPNAVVPFRITKESAMERFRAWVKKKLFAPREFKKFAKAENVNGIYNPAFTYDANTFTYYQGRLGRYHTETTRVNGKTVTKRVLRYFNISGTYSSFFDDILIQAATKIPQKTVDALKPFDTNNANEYQKEFMHGYTANQYDKDGIACWTEARGLIGKLIKDAILRKYTYDVVASFDAKTEYSDVKYKYVLLPLYVGHCSWHKKIYNFFVNGFNGKVSGKTPKSPLKITLAVLLGLGVVAGVVLLAYFMLT